MKKALRNLLIAGVLAIPAYSGISSIYTKYRVYPEIVETKKIDGFAFEIVRTKSKNPLLRVLDSILIDDSSLASSTHTGCFDGKVKSTIDISLIEKDANEIAKDWKSYELNDSLQNPDPSWSFGKQIIYNELKDSKDLRRDYFNKEFKYVTDHELKHAKDLTSGRYLDKAEMEFRAYLSSLNESRLALSHLDDVQRRSSGNSILSSVLKMSGYTWASKTAFEGFLEYKDTKTKYSLANLSTQETSKRAKEIYAKRYNTFPFVKNTLDVCSK